MKKLNTLYGEKIFVKEQYQSFINLSNYCLDPHEIDFLNLELNFHIQPKYDKLHKLTELEILYQNILQQKSKGKVMVNNNLADLLRGESTKYRDTKHHSILTQDLRQAAQRLKSNEEIIIRPVDKTAAYVILDKNDYFIKLTIFCQMCQSLNTLLKILPLR